MKLKDFKFFYKFLSENYGNCNILGYNVVYIKKNLIKINTNIIINNNNLIIYLKRYDNNQIEITNNLINKLIYVENLNTIKEISFKNNNTLILNYNNQNLDFIIKFIQNYIYDVLLNYNYSN